MRPVRPCVLQVSFVWQSRIWPSMCLTIGRQIADVKYYYYRNKVFQASHTMAAWVSLPHGHEPAPTACHSCRLACPGATGERGTVPRRQRSRNLVSGMVGKAGDDDSSAPSESSRLHPADVPIRGAWRDWNTHRGNGVRNKGRWRSDRHIAVFRCPESEGA